MTQNVRSLTFSGIQKTTERTGTRSFQPSQAFLIIFLCSLYNLYYMMSGSKAPDFDAYGLLRATHSHNPTQYSHIVGLSSHFYAHIGAGPKVFHPPMSKLMWA